MLVATRFLTLRQPEGEVKIPIRIYAPEPADRSWGCRYEIDWPDKREDRTLYGNDGMQALLLALTMIGSELYGSDEHKSGNLFFDRPGRGYGFPVVVDMRDQLIGDDAKFF
jgi:uncharacterized protein DUF6968